VRKDVHKTSFSARHRTLAQVIVGGLFPVLSAFHEFLLLNVGLFHEIRDTSKTELRGNSRWQQWVVAKQTKYGSSSSCSSCRIM